MTRRRLFHEADLARALRVAKARRDEHGPEATQEALDVLERRNAWVVALSFTVQRASIDAAGDENDEARSKWVGHA